MTETNNLLDTAIQIAVESHKGQLDKIGEPYILHPLRVMLMQNSEERRIIAVLHDVVEDTSATFEFVGKYFDKDIVGSIEAMTRRDGEKWEDFITRCKMDPDAMYIKMADIADNMSEYRLGRLDSATRERLKKKYKKGMNILLS